MSPAGRLAMGYRSHAGPSRMNKPAGQTSAATSAATSGASATHLAAEDDFQVRSMWTVRVGGHLSCAVKGLRRTKQVTAAVSVTAAVQLSQQRAKGLGKPTGRGCHWQQQQCWALLTQLLQVEPYDESTDQQPPSLQQEAGAAPESATAARWRQKASKAARVARWAAE